jgi:hypothetical protein
MKRVLAHRNLTALTLLWGCVALFALRVMGQLEALLVGPGWLPDMDAWYSGLMPYYLLLPAQIAILMIMSIVAWNRRIRSGAFARANPRMAGALRLFALVYFTVMSVRLGVNVIENGAEFWREGAIPVAFHWVLALFLLVAGRVPPEHREQHEVADDIPYGDVPPIPQPLDGRLCLGEQARYGHAG